MSNADIAFYTAWLYLPWVIKPLWSPVVDILRTRRWWIWTMQLLMGAGFAAVGLTLPLPIYFQASLALFYLVAFSSATHDIAADGYYLLATSEKEQAFFVGIRSTFFRISMIFGQGLLVILAGMIQSHTGLPKPRISVEVTPGARWCGRWMRAMEGGDGPGRRFAREGRAVATATRAADPDQRRNGGAAGDGAGVEHGA